MQTNIICLHDVAEVLLDKENIDGGALPTFGYNSLTLSTCPSSVPTETILVCPKTHCSHSIS